MMSTGKSNCNCGNYLSYGDYLADKKVISAPMMALDGCINCVHKGKDNIDKNKQVNNTYYSDGG